MGSYVTRPRGQRIAGAVRGSLYSPCMSTTLLIHDGSTAPYAPVTRMGGLPLAPAGTAWPVCATCSGHLQFIAQLVLEEERGTVAVFMCANDPGLCEEWSATAGGNRAFLFPAGGLIPLSRPNGEAVLELGAVRGVERVEMPGQDYWDAAPTWAARAGRSTGEVLGQLGGNPDWLQNDETPDCPGCEQPMAFTAQLEEGPESRTAPNFGSGSAYVFTCEPCRRAAFGWQC